MKIKECPFCENEEGHVSSNGVDSWFVVCSICGAEGPSTETEALAVAAWNKRGRNILEENNTPRRLELVLPEWDTRRIVVEREHTVDGARKMEVRIVQDVDATEIVANAVKAAQEWDADRLFNEILDKLVMANRHADHGQSARHHYEDLCAHLNDKFGQLIKQACAIQQPLQSAMVILEAIDYFQSESSWNIAKIPALEVDDQKVQCRAASAAYDQIVRSLKRKVEHFSLNEETPEGQVAAQYLVSARMREAWQNYADGKVLSLSNAMAFAAGFTVAVANEKADSEEVALSKKVMQDAARYQWMKRKRFSFEIEFKGNQVWTGYFGNMVDFKTCDFMDEAIDERLKLGE